MYTHTHTHIYILHDQSDVGKVTHTPLARYTPHTCAIDSAHPVAEPYMNVTLCKRRRFGYTRDGD